MAKINLLTIHYGKCYGAVMQTYATCKLLEEQGHIVRVINIINPSQKRGNYHLSYWKDSIREFQFWLFKKRYFSQMTNKGYSICEIKLPESDVTVVGSDQVWNKDITGCFNGTFFLDFVAENENKVALSSSFGKELWCETDDYTNDVKKYLASFSAISVREYSGVQILKTKFDIEAINLLDPTLAYGKFCNLVLNKKRRKQIFLFLLKRSEDALKRASFISKDINVPLFSHTRFTSRFMNGPRHWLTRIFNSDYIITDSFHGLALSIIFQKQFFVFCADEKKFTRLYSLLKLLGLENRYIPSIEYYQKNRDILLEPIDYAKVNQILAMERNKYNAFIKESITECHDTAKK